MASLKIFKKTEGYSLVEVLIGAAVAGTLAVFVGSVMKISSHATDLTSVQMVIDTLHANAMHYARSPAQLKKILNVDGNTALQNCLTQKGTNCVSQFQKSWQPLQDAAGDLNAKFAKNQGKCTTGPDCIIERVTQYQILCPADYHCNQIEVKIETAYKGPTNRGPFTKRQGTIPMPGAVLLGRAKIDFACAGTDRFVASVDYDRLTASCGNLSGTNSSPSDQPLRIFPVASSTDYQALIQQNCSNGFGKTGMFNGQSACATIGSGGPAPAPSPTCAATDMVCQCNIPNNPACINNCTDKTDYDVKYVMIQNGECSPCYAAGSSDPNQGIVTSSQPTCHMSVYSASSYAADPTGKINATIANPITPSTYYPGAMARIEAAVTRPTCPSGFQLQEIGTVTGVCRGGDCAKNLFNGFGIGSYLTRFRCVKTSCGLDPLPARGCSYVESFTHQYIYPSAFCGSTAAGKIEDGPTPAESILTGYNRDTGAQNCATGYTKVPEASWGAYSQCNADGTRLYRVSRNLFNCRYTGASAGLCAPVNPGGSALSISDFGSCPAPTPSSACPASTTAVTVNGQQRCRVYTNQIPGKPNGYLIPYDDYRKDKGGPALVCGLVGLPMPEGNVPSAFAPYVKCGDIPLVNVTPADFDSEHGNIPSTADMNLSGLSFWCVHNGQMSQSQSPGYWPARFGGGDACRSQEWCDSIPTDPVYHWNMWTWGKINETPDKVYAPPQYVEYVDCGVP